MWVTDILRLLKLHPPIQEAVRGLGPETPRLVCERKPRVVAELPADEQLRAAAEFVPGLIARGPETPRGQVARSRSSAGP